MKFNSKEFVEKYFPEYIVGGEPLRLKTGEGQITGILQTADTTPWRFAPAAEGWQFSGNCTPINYVPHDGGFSTEIVDVSEEEIQAWCDSINWFRNGGLDAYGSPGLDPRKLIGMTKAVGADTFVGPHGKYWPNYGGYALFKDAATGRYWRSENRLPE